MWSHVHALRFAPPCCSTLSCLLSSSCSRCRLPSTRPAMLHTLDWSTGCGTHQSTQTRKGESCMTTHRRTHRHHQPILVAANSHIVMGCVYVHFNGICQYHTSLSNATLCLCIMGSYDFSLVLEPEGGVEGTDVSSSRQPFATHSSLRKKLRSLLSSKTVVDLSHTPTSGGVGETLQVCQWVCSCLPILL